MIKRPYKILIVDDDDDIVEYMKEILMDEFPDELDINGISDPRRALESLNDIQILLTDINMAPVSGDEIITKLNMINKSCIVISMTGSCDKLVVNKRLENGDFNFIRKPIDIAEVSSVMQHAIAHWNLWCKIIDKSA